MEKDAHKWLIATDEAYFYLTESINKQNNRMWLNERPEDWIEKPVQDTKVLGLSTIELRVTKSTTNKMALLLIRLIRFKSGYKVILVRNS